MGRNGKSLMGIPWEWELVTKFGMGMGRNGNRLHGNGREWECKKPFPVISTPAIEVASQDRLRSANRHRLIVPRCRLNTYGRWAFPVAGPTVWNSPPDELRDPAFDVDSFKQFFKTIFFSFYYSATSALEVIF